MAGRATERKRRLIMRMDRIRGQAATRAGCDQRESLRTVLVTGETINGLPPLAPPFSINPPGDRAVLIGSCLINTKPIVR